MFFSVNDQIFNSELITHVKKETYPDYGLSDSGIAISDRTGGTNVMRFKDKEARDVCFKRIQQALNADSLEEESDDE